MNNQINNSEQIFNFYQLINKYNVEIPIIQRDYAQGREDKHEIREIFLSALLSAIIDNRKLKLDFIYGSFVNGALQPLDGQQRLTTLFLLHWYASYKDAKLNDAIRAILSKFSYETRISSRDFCYALVNNCIDNSIDTESLSNSIINSSWFFLSWKKDPTIRAMLCTIDDIERKFKSINNLWDILSSNTCPIYFYFVLLENIGLTDDLYIKMNARGKLLSPFENFKATFQKKIIDQKWEDLSNPINSFVFKIDTSWADFFWINFKNSNNSIDEALMRFISTIMMIRIAIEKTEDRGLLIRHLQENPNNARPSTISKEMYLHIFKYFNLYHDELSEFKKYKLILPIWRHSPSYENENYLSQIVDYRGASYSQKVMFYAQTVYLEKNSSFNHSLYTEWIRVVRNIISRGSIESDGKRPDIIRSPETFDGAINLIEELSKGCSDIYTYLSSDIKVNSTFAKNQVDEERRKAKLISEDIDYKQIIWKLEDTELLMGRIDFAFFCCDNNINKETLQKIADVITKYFSNDKDLTPLLRRALLTINVDGKYEYYNYWWSFWYVGESVKRCLIDKFRVIEYCIDAHAECKKYFKILINKLCNGDTFESIINSFNPPCDMPNWKVRLIKEPDLLSSKFSNFIAIANDESYCYLLKSKRPRYIDGNKKII